MPGFHGNGIRFNEVDFHQREVSPLNFARGRRNRSRGELNQCESSPPGISFETTEIKPWPPSASSGKRDAVVS